MRLLFLASFVSVVAAAATFACSSAAPVKAPADAGRDAKASSTTDDDDNDDDDDTAPPPVVDDDAGDLEAGASDVTTTPTGDAGSQCKTGSTPEAEPNNDAAGATKLTLNGEGDISLCGQVAEGDTDVYTFKHPFSGGFGIRPSGNVTWKFQIGDQTFNGIPNNVNVNADDPWIITVTTTGQAGRSYALVIGP